MKTLIAVIRINNGDNAVRIYQDDKTKLFEVVDFYNNPKFEMISTFDMACRYACQELGIIEYSK